MSHLVLPVHSNFILHSPEKLKIKGLSTFCIHLRNLKISVFCTFLFTRKLRFQCSASRFTEYFVHRKTTQKDLRTRKKSSLSNRQMSKGKSEHQTKNKKKKWKSASPKASPFTKHHKTFHYPERDKIQFSYPIEGPKCGCLRKNSLCSTKY